MSLEDKEAFLIWGDVFNSYFSEKTIKYLKN